MDTIFIIRDSVVTTLSKSADVSQIIIRETETNGQDIWIVAIICVTILIFACIVTCGLIEWQKEKLAKQKEENIAKRTHELAIKEKEASLKELAEEKAHNRKVFDKILDSIIEKEKKASPSDTEDFCGKIKEKITKMKNCFNQIWNEEKA